MPLSLMFANIHKQLISHLKWLMVYILVYSLVLNTSTLDHKLYYIEDTHIHASLHGMVTYYTQFGHYLPYFKLDIKFLD